MRSVDAMTQSNSNGASGEKMLAIERRLALAQLVATSPVVTVEDLARRFAVSPQTIRRDFRLLEDQGLLRRTYGGAVTHDDGSHLSREHGLRAREQEHALQKQAIARAALRLVEPGSTVIFDASTTVLQLVRELPRDIELTAIVNALPVASELSKRPHITLTFLGGSLRHTSLSFIGPMSEATLRTLFADTAFISARGLSLPHGLTEANPYESALKAMMVENASRVVALIDSSKLGRTAMSLFAPATAVDLIVTDDGADPAYVEKLQAAGIDVAIAPPFPAATAPAR